MHDRIVSDARFVDVAKVRQARMMSEEDRVLAGPRLFAGVCERMKEGLRDERPDATEQEIHDLLLQRLKRLSKLAPPPPRASMKQGEEAVAVLLDALNALGLDYMVVGSFSSNRYGVPRATKDADFVLRIVALERERLFASLPAAFKVDPQVSFEMVTGTWRQIIEVPEIPFLIELFELSSDAHDQSRFSRRRKLTLLSRQSWLPTPEDVIIQKLRWSKGAKRSKDFDDAVACREKQPSTGPTSKRGALSTALSKSSRKRKPRSQRLGWMTMHESQRGHLLRTFRRWGVRQRLAQAWSSILGSSGNR